MLAEGVNPFGAVVGLKTDADSKLLISGVTISGDVTVDNVTIDNAPENPVPVTGPLTDTQLRAADVPVTLDGEAVVLGAGSATIGKLGANSGVDIGDVDVLSLPALPAGSNVIGGVTAAQLPASLGAKTAAESLPVTLSTDGAFSVNFGAKADAAAADDTGSYSHLALLKRVCVRLASLIGLFPAALTAGGGLKAGLVDSLPAGTNLIGKIGSDTTSATALTNVSASASNVTVLAANADRKRMVIVNDSTATLYLKFGTTASATSYTYVLFSGDTYESPSNPIYTGRIDGIWSAANGAARVTEFT